MYAPRSFIPMALWLAAQCCNAGSLLSTPNLTSPLASPEEAWLNQMPAMSPNNVAVSVSHPVGLPPARLQGIAVDPHTQLGLRLNAGKGFGSQIICVANNRDAASGIGIHWSSVDGVRMTLQGRGMYRFAQLMRTKPIRESCKQGDNAEVCRTLMITRCD